MNPMLLITIVQIAFPLFADINELLHDKTPQERKATGLKLLAVAGTLASSLVPGANTIVQEVEAAAPAIVDAVFSIIDAAKAMHNAPAVVSPVAAAVADLPLGVAVAGNELTPTGHPVAWK
jgi:hypothetical protein